MRTNYLQLYSNLQNIPSQEKSIIIIILLVTTTYKIPKLNYYSLIILVALKDLKLYITNELTLHRSLQKQSY
jgi:hypothetical protein